MARPGVTYLDVSNAAQQLVAAGKRPTIDTIRMTLGTGSNSTLGAHLRNWKATQNQMQQVASKENLPAELIAALKGVWDRVMEQSEDKIQTIKSEAQQDLSASKHEMQRLQHDITHLQQQHQQLKHEIDGLASKNSAVGQLFANSKIEIAALTEKLSGSETQNQERQAHIDGLNKQNQQIQANLEHYRAASLEQRLADQLRYEQQQKQLEATIQQATLWQQKSQQLGFENSTLKSQLDMINLQYEVATTSLSKTVSELTSKTQEQQHWQTQHAVLSQQLTTVCAELNAMIEDNKALAQEKWILGQENGQLFGQLKQLKSSGRSRPIKL